MNFIPGIRPAVKGDHLAGWLLFHENNLLLTNDRQLPLLNYSTVREEVDTVRFLGTLDGRPCYAARLAKAEAPEELTPCNLRLLFGAIDDDLFKLAGRALHLTYWDQTQHFCGCCGAATCDSTEETAKVCPACGHIAYPRIAPAVIVAVLKEDQILLARSGRFPSNMYSVLAGFVEPGETLEECVRREIREEVGIEVRRIRYFGSQPWPFPDSLMVAFTAEYAGGELMIDRKEIVAAGWYSASRLPEIPGKFSIARQLIDWFITGGARGTENPGEK